MIRDVADQLVLLVHDNAAVGGTDDTRRAADRRACLASYGAGIGLAWRRRCETRGPSMYFCRIPGLLTSRSAASNSKKFPEAVCTNGGGPPGPGAHEYVAEAYREGVRADD